MKQMKGKVLEDRYKVIAEELVEAMRELINEADSPRDSFNGLNSDTVRAARSVLRRADEMLKEKNTAASTSTDLTRSKDNDYENRN